MSDNLTIPDDLVTRLLDARRIAVLTGAGMLAESGVATFRDVSNGLWSQFDPRVLASPQGWANDRDLVWAWYEYRRAMVMKAQPNAGHFAIAQLANALQTVHGIEVEVNVITQNVDDLHERAGTTSVVHLHGSLFGPRCKACGRPARDLPAPSDVPVMKLSPPRCTHCNGYVRPGVVWFGEDLPQGAWRKAKAWVNDCDCLLVIGTSGVVWPAAQLPVDAHAKGKTGGGNQSAGFRNYASHRHLLGQRLCTGAARDISCAGNGSSAQKTIWKENTMKVDNQLQPITNPCAFALVGAMARKHPRANFVSAEFAMNLMQMEGESFSLKEVQASLHQLQASLVGMVVQDEDFNLGFEWHLRPCIVYESLRNGPSGDWPIRLVPLTVKQVESLDEYQNPLPEHALQLRDHCVVRVSVPKDLDEEDVEKITHFLNALIHSGAGQSQIKWPYPQAVDFLDDESFDDEFADLGEDN